ncbi:MAG: PDZ domain-containing protein [Pseudonocardiaceae bacterium]
MSRRTWTLLVSLGLAIALGLLGGLATVPYVALLPGPTFDTLGSVAGKTVVDIKGVQTYPTGGHLNMTTISVVNDVTLYEAMGLWAAGSSALVPREEIFPPNLSQEQVEQQNQQLFRDSESAAETAALRYLGYPSKVVIDQVLPDGAANGKLATGDQLRTLDGQEVATVVQVVDLLATSRPGQLVQVGFQRGDAPSQQVAVELGAGQESSRGYLGVGLVDQPDVDFDITISLADVGGPSAGLMFALSIVDKLTPGPLAGETFIAGTGAIKSGGEVDPIGGIRFKMMRAREAGASVFLVPAANCAEAVARAPQGLRLVRVSTLAEAVHALDELRAGKEPPGCDG